MRFSELNSVEKRKAKSLIHKCFEALNLLQLNHITFETDDLRIEYHKREIKARIWGRVRKRKSVSLLVYNYNTRKYFSIYRTSKGRSIVKYVLHSTMTVPLILQTLIRFVASTYTLYYFTVPKLVIDLHQEISQFLQELGDKYCTEID